MPLPLRRDGTRETGTDTACDIESPHESFVRFAGVWMLLIFNGFE